MLPRLLLPLLLWQPTSSFTLPQPAIHRGHPLFGIPFIGRFRKKKAVVEIPARIIVGSKIPPGDVELLVTDEEGKVTTMPRTVAEVLGNGTAILVGMPGAFTPTCTSAHLPGYIAAAPKLRDLGIDTIAVVTTNDQFVNEEWARKVGLIRAKSSGETGEELGEEVKMLSDGDGDFVKSIGLAEDMGFGVGIRSNRFALIAEAGTVTHLVTDVGMEECSSTTAANMVEYLTPPAPAADEGGFELGEDALKIVGAGLALVITFFAASSMMGGENRDTPVSRSSPAAAVKTAPTKKAPVQTSPSQGSFSLLKEYL